MKKSNDKDDDDVLICHCYMCRQMEQSLRELDVKLSA